MAKPNRVMANMPKRSPVSQYRCLSFSEAQTMAEEMRAKGFDAKATSRKYGSRKSPFREFTCFVYEKMSAAQTGAQPSRDTDERGKLLPCPFCWSIEVERNSDKLGHFFKCECGARGPYADRPAGALLRWNTRAPAGHAERWQPIADFVCGHDNPNVLVADDGVVSEAYYDGESDKWFKAGKSEHDFDFVGSDVLYPSHWMPLPAAPADTEDQGPDTLGERP